MKKLFYSLFLGALISCTQTQSNAQEFNETIKKDITLKSPAKNMTLAVYNLEGSVTVEGYEGSVIRMEIRKTIKGDKVEDTEAGKKEFQLGIDETDEQITLYTAAPYDTRPNQRNQNNREIKYHVKLDYVLKVPKEMNLKISTVNDGELHVSNSSGKLKANNVNGGIRIENAKNVTEAITVNGNIDVTYAGLPDSGSVYRTLNGNINATYPDKLSAEVKLKSMNGNFFTDFPETLTSPRAVAEKENSKSGTVYKLNKDIYLKIGNGGTQMNFETMNGDIYIKKGS